jgi:tRNA threonylcarbamoyl adenosine modification protein (Sua5/YciO/YrdC/YwlC family)
MHKRAEATTMINTIDINSRDLDVSVDQALQWIRAGLIIAAPLENGYVYLSDAFDHDAVRAMHVLRGDALGVAAQVLISGQEVIDGIVRDVSTSARILMSNFWPGQLSFNLTPQRGLSWDLGDGKRLAKISVRVPSAEFVLALLRKSGPLAVNSVAPAGQPPILDARDISAREYDLAGIFDGGVLAPAPMSTVVSDNETGVEVVREGAISIDKLREVLPEIIVSDSSNSD